MARAARPPRRDEERDSPELEVLRQVVHAWPSVEHWIRYPELFAGDLHARAFLALMAHPTVPEAIDSAEPDVAELLTRLATEEAQPDAFDAVVRMLTELARREMAALRSQVAAHPEQVELLRVQHWLSQTIDLLRDPAAVHAAADGLVAWIGSRGEEGA